MNRSSIFENGLNDWQQKKVVKRNNIIDTIKNSVVHFYFLKGFFKRQKFFYL